MKGSSLARGRESVNGEYFFFGFLRDASWKYRYRLSYDAQYQETQRASYKKPRRKNLGTIFCAEPRTLSLPLAKLLR